MDDFVNYLGDRHCFFFPPLFGEDEPVDFLVGTGHCLRAHQIAGERVIEDIVDERTLSGAADTGDATERAEGDFRMNAFEVILARAANLQPLFVARAARFGLHNLLVTTEVLRRE